MTILLRFAAVVFGCVLFASSGCSSGNAGPKLFPADGTATYLGKPLAGATVMFVPEKGPLAMGITDREGKFTLVTGTRPGVAEGSAKATVAVNPPPGESNATNLEAVSKRPQSYEESQAYLKKAEEMQKEMAKAKKTAISKPKPLIPDKYGKTGTSGLNYTINSDGNNHFKIELDP